MKYCPFCGAELLGADISFCAECGKQLPAGAAPQTEPGTPPVASDPQRGKNRNASSARPKRNPRKKNKPVIEPHQAEPVINQSVEDTAQDPAFADEYDGYYDDVEPVDTGDTRPGLDREMIKKIALLIIRPTKPHMGVGIQNDRGRYEKSRQDFEKNFSESCLLLSMSSSNLLVSFCGNRKSPGRFEN